MHAPQLTGEAMTGYVEKDCLAGDETPALQHLEMLPAPATNSLTDRRQTLPFLKRPLDPNASSTSWLDPESQASEWLSLFYDLAVVANLTVFSTSHELSTPASIPVFFSYFAIISWIWTSQIHYDVRYQAEDTFHRFVKGVQITIFVYIGAAGGNWNLGLLQDADRFPDIPGREAAARDAAAESYTTIVLAFIASRALLSFQYAVVAILAHRSGRQTHSQLFLIASLGVSIILSIASLVVPNATSMQVILKIALFYTAILSEIFSVWVQHGRNSSDHVKASIIGERYGAFTLIILGEGFISLTRAFNRAISGLSESNAATYLQVFLSIAILYLLYLFLFAQPAEEEQDHTRHTAILFWELIHFPLHFCLLLLLGAMVNTVVVISFAHGINTVTNEFSISLDHIKNGTSLLQADKVYFERYLDRLTLEPPYEKEYAYLEELSRMDIPHEDPTILGYQYFGQIVLQTTISYGVEISEKVMANFEQLYSLDVGWTADIDNRAQRHAAASGILIEVIQDPVDEALSGVLWLFPCAGAALLLSAIRAFVWSRRNNLTTWLSILPSAIVGISISLLGLLDIGRRDIDVLQPDELLGMNPMYQLLANKLPLVIVVCAYTAVYLVDSLGQRVQWRRKEYTHTKASKHIATC